MRRRRLPRVVRDLVSPVPARARRRIARMRRQFGAARPRWEGPRRIAARPGWWTHRRPTGASAKPEAERAKAA